MHKVHYGIEQKIYSNSQFPVKSYFIVSILALNRSYLLGMILQQFVFCTLRTREIFHLKTGFHVTPFTVGMRLCHCQLVMVTSTSSLESYQNHFELLLVFLHQWEIYIYVCTYVHTCTRNFSSIRFSTRGMIYLGSQGRWTLIQVLLQTGFSAFCK